MGVFRDAEVAVATHFQRVLVPVDFTPRSETALEVASELAGRFGGECVRARCCW